MNYDVAVVNPRTNEQRTVHVELSADQFKAATASPCFQCFVQDIAATDMPAGFMPVGNGAKAVTLQ